MIQTEWFTFDKGKRIKVRYWDHWYLQSILNLISAKHPSQMSDILEGGMGDLKEGVESERAKSSPVFTKGKKFEVVNEAFKDKKCNNFYKQNLI